MVLVLWRIKVIGRPLPRDLLIVGFGFLSYLVILGLSEDESRQPTFSRFQLPAAIFILMTTSTLIRGIRLRTSWLIIASIVAALSIQGGLRLMEREARGQWTVASQYFRTYLTGIELAGSDAVSPGSARIGPWATVSPAEYIEVSNRYGSPAFDRSAIPQLDDDERYWLDTGLLAGTGVGVDANPPDHRRSTCRPAENRESLKAVPGRYRVENGTNGNVTVLVARLGPSPGTSIGAVLPDSAAGMNLPAGDLDEPWKVSFEPASAAVRLCGPP